MRGAPGQPSVISAIFPMVTKNTHSGAGRPWARLVPGPLRDAVRVLRRTPGYARLALVRRWLTPAAGDVSRLPRAPRLLFVCHGNILRSAAAEAVAARMVLVGDLPAPATMSSAGTHAVDGRPADPRGIAVARELGVQLDTHRARRLCSEQVAAADLILAMDVVNEAEIVARFPDAEDKVVLLGRLGRVGAGPVQIPDPFMGDEEEIRRAFQQIVLSLEEFGNLLRARAQPPES